MAYQTHHCSAAFHCSVRLTAFLHTSSFVQFSCCPLLLLHALITFNNNNHSNPNSNNSHHISSLYCVFIAFVHLVHAMRAKSLHTHTVLISSTTRVLCLIIIVTLQLLCSFSHSFSIIVCYANIPQPLWQLRVFVFSVTDKLTFSIPVIGFNSHPAVAHLHEQLHPS
jgi:hypothetical protein